MKAVRWFDSWQKRAVGVAGSVGTVVGAILGVMALISHFQGKGPQPCPGAGTGDISRVTADQRVRYRSFLELSGASTSGTPEERLRAIGRVVHFKVRINGFRDEPLSVTWWVLTKDGEPVRESNLRNQLAATLTPNACSTEGTRAIWVELPKRKGTFRVELRLNDPNNEQLDFARSEPFVVRTS